MACSCTASLQLLHSLFLPRRWAALLGSGQKYYVFHIYRLVLGALAFIWLVWEHNHLSNCLPSVASFPRPVPCQNQQAMAYLGMSNFPEPFISRQTPREIWRLREDRYEYSQFISCLCYPFPENRMGGKSRFTTLEVFAKPVDGNRSQ